MSEHDEPSSPMEDLLAEALARIEDEGAGALDELCAAHPDLADGLRQRVAWLLGTGLAQPEPKDGFRHPDRLGDFDLVEPLGHGGMGVVYRAAQRSLGRDVALKLVRPEQLYFPEARARFQREVTTVAGLAHPGIVPVYAVGEEEGVPYCAMELVQGASLADVLAELAGRAPRELAGADLVAALDARGADRDEPASELFDGPWPTVCARVAREVAEALEHAHRRGVVHRDVKPSNVMVTRGGRVMLVDFGLSSIAEGADERTTRTGAQVGTLAYMSPEQLAGQADVDARADVFSLGVTLYELLTLGLPFAPGDVARVEAAPSLRRHDPRITWELETVVQTAMEPEPGRRYATAQDLADDLTRVLEGRPIEARRSSPWLRARRWVARHPATAIAIAAIVVAPSLLAWQQFRNARVVAGKTAEVERANRDLGEANEALADALTVTERERDAAREARARAERAYDRSVEAIELMLGRVGGEALEDVPGVEPLRRELLGEALRLHEEMLAEPVTDLRQRDLHAATLRRSAAIHALRGDMERALEALEDEARMLDELLEEAPSETIEHRRGAIDARRVEVLKLTGDHAAAEEAAHASIARLEELTARMDDPGAAFLTLAAVRMELADVLTRDGRASEREPHLLRALEDLEAANLDEGEVPRRERLKLAKALYLLGSPPAMVAVVEGVPSLPTDQAMPFLEQSERLYDDLIQASPEDPTARFGLGQTLLGQSVHLAALRDLDGASTVLERAAELFEHLYDQYPARAAYADGYAAANLNLGQISAMLGRHEVRAGCLERSVEGFEALVELAPDVQLYHRNLALARGQLADVTDDPELAVELLELSVDQLTSDWREAPGDPNLRVAVGWTHSRLARALQTLGRPEEIAGVVERVLDLDPLPIELVYAAEYYAWAITVAPAADTPDGLVEEWRSAAFELLATALETAPEDPAVRGELASPELAPLRDDPRFGELLEFYGLGG